jgi:hypothetical protein
MQFVVYWYVLVPFINISSITKLRLHFLALRSKAVKKLRITQAQAKNLGWSQAQAKKLGFPSVDAWLVRFVRRQ